MEGEIDPKKKFGLWLDRNAKNPRGGKWTPLW